MANLNFNPIVLDDDEDEDREVIPIDDDDDDAVVDPVERPNPKVLADNCKDGVKAVFPDICPDYVEKLAAEYHYNLDVTIGVILDRQENGQKYPVRSLLERKRKYGDYENDNDDDDEDEDPGQRVIKAMKAKVAKPGYPGKLSAKEYENIAKYMIAIDFPKVPFRTIQSYFVQNNKSIFGAYTAMDQARRDWNSVYSSWTEKKVPTKQIMDFRADPRPEVQDAWAELEAGRAVRAVEDEKIAKKAAEERNLADAKSAGETAECGCCFDDFALNRMVQCNGEPTHWFCRNCMRRQAEMNIGDSKHELNCMSMDGCSAGFSLAQRNLFLDKKLRTALERIEQETSLRKAGIENLETCPFCPYAAECPPVEVDKEFRCINTSCMKISCRLCRKETHIPKTCAEAATDQGVDARHTLEEAMSAALIRKCNQCDRPYLKSDGCNKIRCTHCGALQCYVCRKTITDYKHFNDINRGGKSGQCPLFDKTEDRHKEEVQRAEEEARRRVAQDNPELDPNALKFNESEAVQRDSQRRKREGDNDQIRPAHWWDYPGVPRMHHPPMARPPAELHPPARPLVVHHPAIRMPEPGGLRNGHRAADDIDMLNMTVAERLRARHFVQAHRDPIGPRQPPGIGAPFGPQWGVPAGVIPLNGPGGLFTQPAQRPRPFPSIPARGDIFEPLGFYDAARHPPPPPPPQP